jgi:hypothetical protein
MWPTPPRQPPLAAHWPSVGRSRTLGHHPWVRLPQDDKITNVDRQTLERRLTVALSNLIVDDWRLLTTWAPSAGAGAERAIAAALGWHIKAVMERSWDVDCEYNRSGTADEAAVKRWLATSDEGATDGRPPPTPVTPDLILHRRGLHGEVNNLLVLEVKKNDDGDDSPTGQTSRGSLKSILDIQKNFGYQHALLLNLRLTPQGPTPQWRACGSNGVSGLITPDLRVWRERCRDDTFCVNLRPRLPR